MRRLHKRDAVPAADSCANRHHQPTNQPSRPPTSAHLQLRADAVEEALEKVLGRGVHHLGPGGRVVGRPVDKDDLGERAALARRVLVVVDC